MRPGQTGECRFSSYRFGSMAAIRGNVVFAESFWHTGAPMSRRLNTIVDESIQRKSSLCKRLCLGRHRSTRPSARRSDRAAKMSLMARPVVIARSSTVEGLRRTVERIADSSILPSPVKPAAYPRDMISTGKGSGSSQCQEARGPLPAGAVGLAPGRSSVLSWRRPGAIDRAASLIRASSAERSLTPGTINTSSRAGL